MSVPATSQQWIDQVNRTLGLGVTADGGVDDTVTPVIWDLHSDKYQPDDYSLQAAYTMRDRARPLIAAMVGKRDYKEGVSEYKDSQLFKQIEQAYTDALNEIDRRITELVANRSGSIGLMVTKAPADPAPGVFDPNDSGFRGDPNRRTLTWPWG